jgi:hypothetical protein
MSIVALFAIAKLWKQHRCPTADEWIKKMWYICMMEFYSVIKNNEIMLFAGWNRRSKTSSKSQRSYVFHHMWKLDL